MRQFIDGNGIDSTAAVLAYLAAGKEFTFADLYLFGELEDEFSFLLTNWESDLTWSIHGVFQRTNIKRGGITSEAGLKVAALNVEWSPQLGTFGTSIATANPYQRAQAGFYDNMTMRLWRTVMPTPGDANTYGACEFFGGRVGDTKVERGKITFAVNSFLDVLDQKIPPNVIEGTNTLAGYAGATPVLADGETVIPRFTVMAPVNPGIVLGDCLTPTVHKIYGDDKFRAGYLVFEKGTTLERLWSPIGANSNYDAGGGTHYNQFNLFSQFPFDPTPGDTFYVSTQFPINLQDGSYVGFPYVPPPETML